MRFILDAVAAWSDARGMTYARAQSGEVVRAPAAVLRGARPGDEIEAAFERVQVEVARDAAGPRYENCLAATAATIYPADRSADRAAPRGGVAAGVVKAVSTNRRCFVLKDGTHASAGPSGILSASEREFRFVEY